MLATFLNILLSLMLGGIMAGCVGHENLQPDPNVQAAQRHAEYVVREARAELADLRKEMADTRIAAAKQEAELQELRQQVMDLKKAADMKQAEFGALRGERDRLLQVQTDLQMQLAELPRLQQAAAEATAAQTRLTELEGLMTARTSELTQVKNELEQYQAKFATKQRNQAAQSKRAGPVSGKSKVPESSFQKAALNQEHDAGAGASSGIRPPAGLRLIEALSVEEKR